MIPKIGHGWLAATTGWFRLIARLVPEGSVAGVEVSDEMIRQARELSKGEERVRFEVGTADHLPFPDATITCVVSIESAHYWPDPDDRIPDPTPAPAEYARRWFRDAEQLRRFRAEGALLIYGAKPAA